MGTFMFENLFLSEHVTMSNKTPYTFSFQPCYQPIEIHCK